MFHMSFPSSKNRSIISHTSHFNHGAHHASKAKHKRNHTRTERIIEDSEFPVIQCDNFSLKDAAGTSGLKVLSMYVRSFGYGIFTVVETKDPTDMFPTMWAVKMLNFLGLSDITVQGDPEPSLIKWGRKYQVQTNRANSHSKFSQTVASKQRRGLKTIKNSCRDRCAQCWQQCESTRNTNHPPTAP